jgi:hypothetical protein
VNRYTPSRYAEHVSHLALGIEIRDATSGNRLGGDVEVRIEDHPRPLHRWRSWRPGESLTAALPAMHRHRSGRFARRYDEGIPTIVDLRVVDSVRSGSSTVVGHGRHIVPRRVRVTLASEQVVIDADADPTGPGHPLWRRSFPIGLFPGSTAPIPPRSTVLRGRVVRTVNAATGERAPVRWCRIQARGAGGDELGWAHGDDRGEFVLIVVSAASDIVVPPDPMPVRLTIGARIPPLAPDVGDPLRPQVDPLWDLPVEPLTASASPDSEPSITGRGFAPGQAPFGPFAFSLPLGRETSVEIPIA